MHLDQISHAALIGIKKEVLLRNKVTTEYNVRNSASRASDEQTVAFPYYRRGEVQGEGGRQTEEDPACQFGRGGDGPGVSEPHTLASIT